MFPGAHEMYGRPEIAGDESGTGTWIALLLPLTGQGSDFASHVSSGARLAFDRHAEMHQDSPELIDFDTRGDPARLSELMESLAGNESCVAVLGPLTSSSTMTAGAIAKEANLPLLTPTATSGDVDRIGEPVFRLVVSEGNQAAAVAEYAVRTEGYTRFGIIYPHTAQGNSEAEQFRAVVESMGGEVVSSQGYQPGVTDFKTQINLVKSRSPQAIFLPVSALGRCSDSTQLRFYNLQVPFRNIRLGRRPSPAARGGVCGGSGFQRRIRAFLPLSGNRQVRLYLQKGHGNRTHRHRRTGLRRGQYPP